MKFLFTVACCLLALFVYSALADNAQRRRDRPNRQHTGAAAGNTSSSSCPARQHACERNCGAAGFKVNRAGCQTCWCRRVANCSQLDCPDRAPGACPYGVARDESGCPLCECAPPPVAASNCSAARCRRVCPDGLKLGADGCPICECYQPPPTVTLLSSSSSSGAQCGNVSCFMECPNGRETGPDGCPSCRCRPAPAPDTSQCRPIRCRNTCAFGRHTNRNGCEICACRHRAPAVQPLAATVTMVDPDGDDEDPDETDDDDQPSTPAPVCGPSCLMYCPNGFKKDSRGCPTCQCQEAAPAGGASAARPVPARRRRPSPNPNRARGGRCLGPQCAMFCPNGFKTDSNGCAVCACRDPEPIVAARPSVALTSTDTVACQTITCTNPCAFGYNVNSMGCQTCTCKARADPVPGQARRCPAWRCRKNCPGGFKRNARGCEVCQCAPEEETMQSDEPTRAEHRPNIALDGTGREATVPGICALPRVVGPCRAAFRRWFYSASLGQCQQFVYGGCRGNANNFHSEDQCRRQCINESERAAIKQPHFREDW